MKRDPLLMNAQLATLHSHQFLHYATPSASFNIFMIVLHLGACLNYYSLSSIPIVYLSLHSMIVSTHKNNLRLTTATHSSYNPTLVVTGTDMNTWSPLSNLFLPPPFSQTSSNLSPGRNLRPVKVPTSLICFSPFSLPWVLCLRPISLPPLMLSSEAETPHQYYQRIFIFSLRFPSLTTLGVPSPDVLAIEEAVKHTLLCCSLPQALDFLHTQLLAGICVSNPVRESTSHPSPPLACLTFPPRVLADSATPPQFRCWITRLFFFKMAVISLKCSSTPWACSLAKGILEGSYHFGFIPGNFLQLAFSCTTDFPADSSHFALYPQCFRWPWASEH